MKILYYILMAASLLALLVNWRRLDRRLHLFLPLLVMAMLPDSMKDLLGEDYWLSNFLFSIYTPVEYLLLCVIIASFINKKILKANIYISIPLVIAFSFYVQGWLKQKGSFYGYLDILVAAPLICVWTLLYFFQMATDKKDLSITGNPLFWISIGNLLFYSASTFSYGFGSYLVQMGKGYISKEYVYPIAQIFNLVLYIFYIIGFLWNKISTKTK